MDDLPDAIVTEGTKGCLLTDIGQSLLHRLARWRALFTATSDVSRTSAASRVEKPRTSRSMSTPRWVAGRCCSAAIKASSTLSRELRSVIKGAGGVLIATLEYNGSIPGQLKDALDWASRPRGAAVLEGKPVATLSASPSRRRGAGAQADLRQVLGVLDAEIRGEEIAVPHIHEQLDEDGGLVDQKLRAQLRSTLAALIGPLAAAVSAPVSLRTPTLQPRTMQTLAA
jgi:NAD(P)H-dependent FMN reductase